jgi:HlyD family secretion protein
LREAAMKRLIRWLVILGVLGGVGWAIAAPVAGWLRERSRVTYREAVVTRGRIVAVVNSTGNVKPVRSVSVGAFVSGPVVEICVDFNDEVKKEQVLAKIDPKIYEAAVAGSRAALATRRAEVKRTKANLQQACNNEKRALTLQAQNKNFISDQEMDQFKYAKLSLDADLLVAETSVEQAQAALEKAEADLAYTIIRSPVDGVVIDRKIDPGQTMTAGFQTPEMFIVAPDLKAEMHVYANVDEADIGMIRKAQEAGQPVRFTVDAYPDDLFEGKIFQIRKSSTTTQNVVTYPVVVSAPNPDLKLLPGMTANLSFQLQEVHNVLRVPSAALRFYPQREQVRPEDRVLMENKAPEAKKDDDNSATSASAEEKAELRRNRNRRHVWVVDGDFLRAVPVVTGVSSNQYTEVVSGDLHEGDKLVVGLQQ